MIAGNTVINHDSLAQKINLLSYIKPKIIGGVILWLLPENSKQQLGFDEINLEQFFMSIFELNLADSKSSGSLRPGFQAGLNSSHNSDSFLV
jgi:hypothetical protein